MGKQPNPSHSKEIMPDLKQLDIDAGHMLCKECRQRVFVLTPTTKLYLGRCELCDCWSVTLDEFNKEQLKKS